MKILRYRKPSINRILGITTVKRRIKHQLGISQVQGWTRPTRIKQRIKYRAGWYSPQMRWLETLLRVNFLVFSDYLARNVSL